MSPLRQLGRKFDVITSPIYVSAWDDASFEEMVNFEQGRVDIAAGRMFSWVAHGEFLPAPDPSNGNAPATVTLSTGLFLSSGARLLGIETSVGGQNTTSPTVRGWTEDGWVKVVIDQNTICYAETPAHLIVSTSSRDADQGTTLIPGSKVRNVRLHVVEFD